MKRYSMSFVIWDSIVKDRRDTTTELFRGLKRKQASRNPRGGERDGREGKGTEEMFLGTVEITSCRDLALGVAVSPV